MTDTQEIIIYGWLISVPCIALVGGIWRAISSNEEIEDDDSIGIVGATALFWPVILITLVAAGLFAMLLWGPSAIRDLFKGKV